MNKKLLITVLLTITALLGIVVLVSRLNLFNKLNKTGARNDVSIQLINPTDNRVLTKRGEQVLTDLIRNKNYSHEVVNTDSYSEWQPIIEKSPRLQVLDVNTGISFIIPSNVAYWKEGKAFEFTPAGTEQHTGTKVNIIYFSQFQLKDFLSTDLNI